MTMAMCPPNIFPNLEKAPPTHSPKIKMGPKYKTGSQPVLISQSNRVFLKLGPNGLVWSPPNDPRIIFKTASAAVYEALGAI
jgi:hypothetical protein